MNEFRFGTLPDGWQKMPMRRCLLMRQNGSWGDEPIDDGDGEYCLRAADFDYPRLAFKGEENFVRRSYGPGAFENVHLKDGDILIEKSGGGEKTPVGRAIMFDGSFTAGFSNFMERQRVNAQICVPEYYFYWWTAMYQQDVFTQYIKQTTGLQNLDTGTLLSQEYMPLPPLNEQEQIAKAVRSSLFDIQKTTDQLCAQISTLERYKSSLIHEAVTKGLDRDVPMRPSGVEWIGDIPEGWHVTRLKYALESPMQYGAAEAGDSSLTNAPRYIRITDIDSTGHLRREGIQYLDRYVAKPYMLCDGDVLFARSGATVGKTYLYRNEDGPCCFAGYLIRAVTNRRKLVPDYLVYLTKGHGYQIWKSSAYSQSTIPNINAEQYANIPLPLPTIEIQREIVAFLDEKCAHIDCVLDLKRRQADVLRRRRQSLIYEYVTGKRRVIQEA